MLDLSVDKNDLKYFGNRFAQCEYPIYTLLSGREIAQFFGRHMDDDPASRVCRRNQTLAFRASSISAQSRMLSLSSNTRCRRARISASSVSRASLCVA